jgi:type IV pilus assembly protein PilP
MTQLVNDVTGGGLRHLPANCAQPAAASAVGSARKHVRGVACLLIAGLYLGLTACSSADDELSRFLEDTRKEPGGRVEPLPEVKPYETFAYSVAQMRSPFLPGGSGAGSAMAGLRPDSKRNREFLEQFSLDTLKMVGTLKLGGHMYGLVQTKDGLVHRVTEGNYVGQADGKITAITPAKISVTEIVPDGLGGYMERPAALGLNE